MILYNEHTAVPVNTIPTRLVIICLRENGCVSSAMEGGVVGASELRSLRLGAAGALRRVPQEAGSGTAALSGDKVIRTGNNERERKS